MICPNLSKLKQMGRLTSPASRALTALPFHSAHCDRGFTPGLFGRHLTVAYWLNEERNHSCCPGMCSGDPVAAFLSNGLPRSFIKDVTKIRSFSSSSTLSLQTFPRWRQQCQNCDSSNSVLKRTRKIRSFDGRIMVAKTKRQGIIRPFETCEEIWKFSPGIAFSVAGNENLTVNTLKIKAMMEGSYTVTLWVIFARHCEQGNRSGGKFLGV